jgi:hypothetical protein
VVHVRVELVAHVGSLLSDVDRLHRPVPFVLILTFEEQDTERVTVASVSIQRDKLGAVLSVRSEPLVIGDNLENWSGVVWLSCSLEKRVLERKQGVERGSTWEITAVSSVGPGVRGSWHPSHGLRVHVVE